VQNVMTHEVGHFFGLGEDMEDSSATMYYCTNRCETHKRVLTVADASVMTTLYPEDAPETGESKAAGCGGARLARGQGGARPEWVLVLGVLFAVARRRRSRI
jgi:hypothetical protein